MMSDSSQKGFIQCWFDLDLLSGLHELISLVGADRGTDPVLFVGQYGLS